jgi:hypothetical protein
MRNVFQSVNYIESEIVSNMLAANGIEAMVNRHSVSRTGAVCSEVWIHDDGAGERANKLVRSFLARQASTYRGNRGIAFALNILGVLSVLTGIFQLAVGLFDGDRVATAATFITIGVFLYSQGNAERRASKHHTAELRG